MPYKESISPNYWIIKEGAFQEIKNILKMQDFSLEKALWITTPSMLKIIPKDVQGRIVQISSKIPRAVDKIEDARYYLYKETSSIIVALGGGRVIDTAKLLAKETSHNFISIPTILSSDAIASPISIVDHNSERVRIGALPPKAVIIDLDIVKSAPIEYNLAGIGDLISNLSAINDWLLSAQKGIERVNPLAKYIAYTSSLRLLNSNNKQFNGSEFLTELSEGLILSGISMTIAGSSRPASGSEHNISHALDRILGTNRKLHGIQVGFATLLTLHLQGQDKFMQYVREFYKRISFPTTFSELGISRETFMKAVQLAPSIRNRYTILNEVGKKEIIKAIDEVYEL